MVASALLGVLRESVRSSVGDEKQVAVAYSGGLDSSVIAALARERAEVRAYTCSAGSSFDGLNADKRARTERLQHAMLELSPEDIVDGVRLAGEVIGSSDPTRIAYTIPLMTVVVRAQERTVLAGNGADELFGGYAKYLRAADPLGLMANDLGKAIEEAGRIRAWAMSTGKSLEFPFLAHEVMELSASLGMEEKISGSTRKVILREVAGLLNLPSSQLPKKAAQYSSGVMKAMEGAARASGLTVVDWTRKVLSEHRRSA